MTSPKSSIIRTPKENCRAIAKLKEHTLRAIIQEVAKRLKMSSSR